MRNRTLLTRSFNWRMLLMRVLVNMLALLVTVLIVPRVTFVDRSLGAWILMAVGLGMLNALIRPLIQFLTLRFIFITGGLVLIGINTVILYLLAWLLPGLFAIDGLLWAIVAGVVLGLASAFLENLLGLTVPIISDKYPELQQRVKDRQFYRMQSELTKISTLNPGPARELAAVKAIVVDTHPTVSELLQPDGKGEADGLAPAATAELSAAGRPASPASPTAVEKSLLKGSESAELPAAMAVETATAGVPVDTVAAAKSGNSLDYIKGIGPTYRVRLQQCGINTIDDLLERGASRKDRKDLIERSGISSRLILRWVNHADLMRIEGVDAQEASLLEAAGVDSVIELAQRNPDHLYARMLAVNEGKKLAHTPPEIARIADWIKLAKEMPRVITY